MHKRFKTLFAISLLSSAVPFCSSCSDNSDVFHIMTWNEEWKTIFKNYCCEKKGGNYFYKGKLCKFTTVSNENSAYQMALDRVLKRNAIASRGDKIDMFLAESDYINKYVNSAYTKDIGEYNIDMTNVYPYTKTAASDDDGHCKGVSFQCCPSGIIYRRSIAEKIFGNGNSSPEYVQDQINTWEKFNSVAATAASKDCYMTGSFACTFRIYSSNVTTPWVDSNKNLHWDDSIVEWVKSTEDFVKKGYTQTSTIFEKQTTAQMYKTGKTFCFDGPAWYYNFSMTNAKDPDYGCPTDWGIVQGPTPHFWGGTWLIAASNTDDDELVKSVMNDFINDDDLLTHLIKDEQQYVNNSAKNISSADQHSNPFLNGQNDIEFFNGIVGNITFENKTIYDQDLNEGLQRRLQEHYINPKSISLRKAILNFYTDIQVKYPQIKIDTSYIPGE